MDTRNTDKLGFLVHDSARLIRKTFEEATRELGLSATQWRLLFNLKRYGPMAQARLAERLEIEPISVSRLIDRMEKAGWVERTRDEQDRRAYVVTPTQQTATVFENVRGTALDVYEKALAGLDEAARAALIHGLQTIAANLSGPDDLLPQTFCRGDDHAMNDGTKP